MSDNSGGWRRLAEASRSATGLRPPEPPAETPALSPDGATAVEPDDEPYEAPAYSAVRRIRSSAIMDVAFFDTHGGIDLLSWGYYSHARVTDTTITMRWAGLVVVLEGRNLRALHADIQRRQVAEFRAFRSEIWALPPADVPMIVRIEILPESASS